jgi:hypothetical protein
MSEARFEAKRPELFLSVASEIVALESALGGIKQPRTKSAAGPVRCRHAVLRARLLVTHVVDIQ